MWVWHFIISKLWMRKKEGKKTETDRQTMIFMNKKTIHMRSIYRKKTHRKQYSPVLIAVFAAAVSWLLEPPRTHIHIASDSDVNHFISVASNECVLISMLFYTAVRHIIGYIIRPFLIQFNVILPFLESILSPLIYRIEMQCFCLSISVSRHYLIYPYTYIYIVSVLYWATNILAHSTTHNYIFFSLHGFMITFWGFFYTICTLCDIWNEAMLQIVFIFRFGLFFVSFSVSTMVFFSTHKSKWEREKNTAQNDNQMCVRVFVFVKEMSERALNVTIVCLAFVLWSHAFWVYGTWRIWKWWKQSGTVVSSLVRICYNFNGVHKTHAAVD